MTTQRVLPLSVALILLVGAVVALFPSFAQTRTYRSTIAPLPEGGSSLEQKYRQEFEEKRGVVEGRIQADNAYVSQCDTAHDWLGGIALVISIGLTIFVMATGQPPPNQNSGQNQPPAEVQERNAPPPALGGDKKPSAWGWVRVVTFILAASSSAVQTTDKYLETTKNEKSARAARRHETAIEARTEFAEAKTDKEYIAAVGKIGRAELDRK